MKCKNGNERSVILITRHQVNMIQVLKLDKILDLEFQEIQYFTQKEFKWCFQSCHWQSRPWCQGTRFTPQFVLLFCLWLC